MRHFAGIDLGCEAVPDATTHLKFRRLLEKHNLNLQLLVEVGRVLQGSGMTLKTGTIVDATIIIAAPSSTKNADKKRDPAMRQTRKGQQWCFGMKLHIGADSQSGLAHSAVLTPTNVHDKHPLPALLYGQEQRVYGDRAYASQKDLVHSKAPNAKDFTNCRTVKPGEVEIVPGTMTTFRLMFSSFQMKGRNREIISFNNILFLAQAKLNYWLSGCLSK